MIQEKLQEIHHKFGISEMANYKIQLFIDSLIEQDQGQSITYTRC